MKIPLSWLREYVDITFPSPQLIERLTLAGLEVAGVRVFGLPVPEGVRVKAEERGPVWDRDKIVIARDRQRREASQCRQLKLPTVACGEGKVKQLVTGAPNIKVGDGARRSSSPCTGSVLFDGHCRAQKSQGAEADQDPRRPERCDGLLAPASWASPTSTRASSSSKTTPRSACRSPISWATSSWRSTCCRTWPAACR